MNRRSISRRPRLAILGLATLALLGPGAAMGAGTPAAIRVLSPADTASLTLMPLTVELDLDSDADGGSLLVTLNGADITSLLTLEPPQSGRMLAWADFVWGASLVLAGANQLDASVLVNGMLETASSAFTTGGDPYADAVVSTSIGASGGFNLAAMPDVVLGPPTGSGLFGGTLGVLSLGLSGEVVLEFTDNAIVDGPGVDFTVFENPFFGTGLFDIVDQLFSEPGTVSVSQDGVVWHSFSCAMDALDAPYYDGCAGVYPVLANGETDSRHPAVPTFTPSITSFIGQVQGSIVVPDGSGGDSFDLADLGIAWARYVKIEAADHVNGPYGPDNAGFDLDAVTAVHSIPLPEPASGALLAAGGSLLAVLAQRRRRRVAVECPRSPRAPRPRSSRLPLAGSGTITRSSSAK